MWILNPTQEDTFVPYFMQIRRAIASTNSPEKKKRKKSDPTEKYYITPDFEKFHFYKNGNIINAVKFIISMDCGIRFGNKVTLLLSYHI